jgi:hypothetical protein
MFPLFPSLDLVAHLCEEVEGSAAPASRFRSVTSFVCLTALALMTMMDRG